MSHSFYNPQEPHVCRILFLSVKITLTNKIKCLIFYLSFLIWYMYDRSAAIDNAILTHDDGSSILSACNKNFHDRFVKGHEPQWRVAQLQLFRSDFFHITRGTHIRERFTIRCNARTLEIPERYAWAQV